MDLVYVEIEVHLNEGVMFSDLKTVPLASSFQNKRALWKARQLAAGSVGSLLLQIIECNVPSEELVRELRMRMGVEKEGLLQEVQACLCSDSERVPGQKYLEVEYLIA